MRGLNESCSVAPSNSDVWARWQQQCQERSRAVACHTALAGRCQRQWVRRWRRRWRVRLRAVPPGAALTRDTLELKAGGPPNLDWREIFVDPGFPVHEKRGVDFRSRCLSKSVVVVPKTGPDSPPPQFLVRSSLFFSVASAGEGDVAVEQFPGISMRATAYSSPDQHGRDVC